MTKLNHAEFAPMSGVKLPEHLGNVSILIVDDDESIRLFYRTKLEQCGIKVTEAITADHALDILREQHFECILLDLYLGDVSALDRLPEFVRTSPRSKVVIFTSHGSIECAVEALGRGASGFLLKTDSIGDNLKKLFSYINAFSEGHGHGLNFASKGIIGCSESMQHIYRTLAKVSPTDMTVLINGESGTGKEVIARLIHDTSTRKDTGPFIAVNCGAISENLLEAELFGSKKGSYTGSTKDRIGYFEACNNGTLFLDEIGEMSPALQVKLLRVLQEREVTPIGSTRPVHVNARVIAATNCNLLRDMKSGRFREDLFYRLSVVKIDLPPLRDRASDIAPLIRHFMARSNEKFGKSVAVPKCNIMAKLQSYSWPGNVRELANSVERAVLLADGEEVSIEDLIPLRTDDSGEMLEERFAETRYPLDYSEAKEVFERSYIEQLLRSTNGNIAEAANISGQYRPAIYRLLQKHRLNAAKFKYNVAR